jgi:hypothetical protein
VIAESGSNGARPAKPIRLSQHALGYLVRRGFTITEVERAIREGRWQPAELGRLEAVMDFPFDSVWNGRYYSTKRVRPIFVDEPAEIFVITVYTYYF